MKGDCNDDQNRETDIAGNDRGWIEKNKERYRIFGFGLWAVCLKDTGEMIGDCGLTMQNIGGVIKPEIGYHMRKDMQCKGFAKEAAREAHTTMRRGKWTVCWALRIRHSAVYNAKRAIIKRERLDRSGKCDIVLNANE